MQMEKAVSQVEPAEVGLELCLGILAYELLQLLEVMDSLLVVTTVVIGVATVVEIEVLFKREHLVVVTRCEAIISVALVEVTQCHVGMGQAIVDGSLLFVTHSQRVGQEEGPTIDRGTLIKLRLALVGIGQVDEHIGSRVRLVSTQAIGVGTLKTENGRVCLTIAQLIVSLHIKHLTGQVGQVG